MDFNKKTLGEQIADMLKAKIDRKEYKDGKLPKEEDLAIELQVSRGTIRSAMAMLENENLIVRIKKKGTFIKGIVALIPETKLTRRLNLFFYSHIANFHIINKEGFYGQLFSSILSEATKKNYVLNVSILDKGDQRLSSIEKCLELSADGNIFMALEDRNVLKMFLERQTPCLLLDHQFDDLEVDVVNVENYNTSCKAVKYLYDKGHRRFLFFNHHRIEANVERSSGVTNTLRELGIPSSNITEYPLVPGVERGEIAMSSYLQNGGIRHSAMITFSAEMAIGAINALTKEGFSVPEDMSILSLSNMGEVTNPILATVDYDINAMGKLAVDRIVEMIEEKVRRPQIKLLSGNIIDRGSIRSVK